MKQATRAAYGETLVELAKEGLEVVAVDADLACCTTTKKLGDFKEGYTVNAGISEQNMIGVAAGLSLAGMIPFTASFAAFGAGRCYEQIRNSVCYPNLNVKVCPTHAGITVGPDGGSHQMIEDIALMRVLPNMRVLTPADFNAAKQALKIAAKTPGPFFVRLGRVAVEDVYDEKTELELGKSYVLRKGSDVTIIACGVEVGQALDAAKELEKKGVSAEVIDAFCIKPLDEKTLLESAKKTGCVVSAEEHNMYGGLGGAVAEVLSKNMPLPLEIIAVKDKFGHSGSPEELMAKYEIDADAIVKAALKAVDRK